MSRTRTNFDSSIEDATALLDHFSKRGDAIYRSKATDNGVPAQHLVMRDDLEKAIRFLKNLVETTDKALAEH